jgi:hypothetical protein
MIDNYIDKVGYGNVGLNPLMQYVRPNVMIPDNRSLVEREKDFLKKFELGPPHA